MKLKIIIVANADMIGNENKIEKIKQLNLGAMCHYGVAVHQLDNIQKNAGKIIDAMFFESERGRLYNSEISNYTDIEIYLNVNCDIVDAASKLSYNSTEMWGSFIKAVNALTAIKYAVQIKSYNSKIKSYLIPKGNMPQDKFRVNL